MLPPHPHFNLFQLDFDVKFPLFRLLLFLIGLKSTIIGFVWLEIRFDSDSPTVPEFVVRCRA